MIKNKIFTITTLFCCSVAFAQGVTEDSSRPQSGSMGLGAYARKLSEEQNQRCGHLEGVKKAQCEYDNYQVPNSATNSSESNNSGRSSYSGDSSRPQSGSMGLGAYARKLSEEQNQRCGHLEGVKKAQCEYDNYQVPNSATNSSESNNSGRSSYSGDSSRPQNPNSQLRDFNNTSKNLFVLQCIAYGFREDSGAMAQCVMQLDLAHKQLQQQQQQAEAAYNQKLHQCRSMMMQSFGGPTLSGNFWDSLGNANAAYQNCMAGVPTAPTQVICRRSPNPQVNYIYCTTL